MIATDTLDCRLHESSLQATLVSDAHEPERTCTTVSHVAWPHVCTVSVPGAAVW